MYVEAFSNNSKMMKLLEAMRIDPSEEVKNHTSVCLNGVLKVYHQSYAKMHGKKMDYYVSVFKDFKVVRLYNSKPSAYDQEHYRNVMCSIFKETNYKKELKKAIAEEEEIESE